MTYTQTIYTPDKFQNAEQMWFWFLYSKSVRNNSGFHKNHQPSKRVCELVDVETLVTKLYLAGKLNLEHLGIMKEFGDKRRAPHQYIWRENRAAAIWNEAMKILNDAATEKGWIE
ncbi:MAG: hypothetical protein K5912_01540 [Alphaproteobacteria bacterium]|nr:hypothetical protein [Alphaproteobacteria bacterium]